MSRRYRLLAWIVGGLVLALVLAALIAVYVLLRPERFTAMLQQQARQVGLELNLASPASPTLFPRPALDLHGITLSAQGANMPILLAARGQLALPWRTLLGGPTVITQLKIDSPRVDLDALQAWLAAMPAQPDNAPPNIPRIDTGVSISRGSVVHGNQLLLDHVSLQAGSLLSGQPFPLSLSASTASGTPIQLRLSATPTIKGNTLQLQQISAHYSQGSTLTLMLGGNARWHGAADASATLSGKLDDANVGQYDIALALTAADQNNPLLLALKLDGPDNHVDLRLPPLALTDWWTKLNDSTNPQLNMPPGDGQVDIASLDLGDVGIEGLTVRMGDRVPTPASSSATPAMAASTKPSPTKP